MPASWPACFQLVTEVKTLTTYYFNAVDQKWL